MTEPRKDASAITMARNAEMAGNLKWDDNQSFEDASKGFIATWDPLTITDSDGKVIWDLVPYLKTQTPGGCQAHGHGPGTACTPAPDTVNPSLWRQAQLNDYNGLFEVCPGLYQVRGFDMSNMTIIEGTSGLIIIDPLISVECAKSALTLYRQYRPETAQLDVTAVIYTHSHVDHFGGVEGIMPDDPIKRTAVQIYAPQGFLEHAVSENVYAGCAMGRRAQYMYGPILPKDNKGQVDTGLGKGQSMGSISLYPPTVEITQADQTETIAGIEVQFHLTPGSEAPAEMDFYFPDFNAFCAAENATHNMHNIQTLRGANVRNALAWSKYLGEALDLFGGKAQVMFASHHWPIWGADRVSDFLSRQRDMYRYLNDQTLRMLNKGYTGTEIAEIFEMPETLAQDWSCRGYYGSVSHNTKAVYDRYMGWYDGDPANLHRLTSEDAAPKYVALMGGADAVLAAAKQAGERGEYRWAAELARHVVFADQTHSAAKNLEADMLEQMGYQSENATWRNVFLAGAQELRGGVRPTPDKAPSPTMIAAMTTDMIFDSLAARLIGPWVGPTSIAMNWIFTDPSPSGSVTPYLVTVSNGAMSNVPGKQDPKATVTITLSRDTLNKLMAGEISLRTAVDKGWVSATGDLAALLWFFCLLDDTDPSFPIVTPRDDAKKAWLGESHLADLRHNLPALLAHPKVAKERRFFGEWARGC